MELCLAPAKKGNVIYKTNRPYCRIRSPVDAKENFFFLETSDDTDSNELVGTLSIEEHTYKSWPVVIKVANGQKDTLLLEYVGKPVKRLKHLTPDQQYVIYNGCSNL